MFRKRSPPAKTFGERNWRPVDAVAARISIIRAPGNATDVAHEGTEAGQETKIPVQGAEAFSGTAMRSSARQKQVWNSNDVTCSHDGWRSYDALGREQRAIRAQETAKGAMDSATMRRMLNDMADDIRRVMMAREKVEFQPMEGKQRLSGPACRNR